MTARWWHSFFDETYADFGLATTTPERVARAVNFLLDKLDVKAGDRLLDQCCGIGRLSLPLARHGVHVVGVDQEAGYVERARAHADQLGVSAKFHCADAFEFVAEPPCDAACNWFTSFGYDDDDQVNIRMFQRVFESLRPGGRFAVDYLSMPMIFARFQTRHFTEQETGGLIVLEAPTPDFARGMLDCDWTFIHPDGKRTRRRVSTRMYLPHEIVALLRRSGFGDVDLYGSTDGEPYDRLSPRCIAVARK